MKRALLLCAIVCSGCGGSDSSSYVTSPTPVVPVPSMNIVGSWAGTFTGAGTVTLTGERLTTQCTEIWAITSQSGNQFSGNWQRSGGNCAQAGTFSGTISPTGALSNVSFGVSSGLTPPQGLTCSQV